MITEEQFKEQCAEILRNNITFAGQIGDYVIHGALDALWKLHTEQKLNKHGVSGSWIDASQRPTTTDCVAVIVDTCKYPTIGWWSKEYEEWVLEDREVKGYVLAWYPLPNYR